MSVGKLHVSYRLPILTQVRLGFVELDLLYHIEKANSPYRKTNSS